MGKLSMLKELWSYFRIHKKWWLAPIIIMFLLIGFLMFYTQGSSMLAPLIYAVF